MWARRRLLVPGMLSRRLLWTALLMLTAAMSVASLFCLHQDNGSTDLVEQIHAELDKQALSEARIEKLFGKPGERRRTISASGDPDSTQVSWRRKTWDRGFIEVWIEVDAKGELHGVTIAESRPFWQWAKDLRSRMGI